MIKIAMARCITELSRWLDVATQFRRHLQRLLSGRIFPNSAKVKWEQWKSLTIEWLCERGVDYELLL